MKIDLKTEVKEVTLLTIKALVIGCLVYKVLWPELSPAVSKGFELCSNGINYTKIPQITRWVFSEISKLVADTPIVGGLFK